MTAALQHLHMEETLPEREYYVARRPNPPACRHRRHRRRVPLLPALLALLLFGGGFLLGKASAASPPGSPGDGSRTLAASLTLDDSAPDTSAITPVQPLVPAQDAAGQSESEADWNLLLVNWENPIPEDFTVPELTQLKNSHAIDSRAYPALQAMMDAARAEGLQPLICSSYRAWDKQAQLFDAKTQFYLDQGYARAEAEYQAATWVARPGTSEHQTGLAVDIVDTNYQLLDQAQENTPVQQWLMAHCAEYGFILRYPTDKSGLTGVNYEPWHYRYVGQKAAQEIMEQGICLEEYLAA